MTDKKCEKCKGAGQYMYDENHIKPCEVCCTHSKGWWKMEDNYGNDNGKFACKNGCGTVVDKEPNLKETIKEVHPYDEVALDVYPIENI